MELGPIANRGAGPAPAIDPSRVRGEAAAATAGTELPSRQTVEQSPAAGPAGLPDERASRPAPPAAAVQRELTIDAATHSLVSRVFDRASGDLLSQVPDQALLRLKTYAREAVQLIEERSRDRRVERRV